MPYALKKWGYLIFMQIAGLAAFVLLLPMREGLDWLILLAGELVLCALLWGWWRLVKKSWWLVAACVPALAWLAYSFLILDYTVIRAVWHKVAEHQTRQLLKEFSIISYKEDFITWEGFEFPVGMAVTIEVAHPSSPVVMYPPVLASSQTNPHECPPEYNATLCETAFAPYTFSTNKLYQPPMMGEGTQTTPLSATQTRWRFQLFSGTVKQLEPGKRICIVPSNAILQTGERTRFKAYWKAGNTPFPDINALRDFSAQLTAAVEQHSRLQRNPPVWGSLQRALTPANIEKAGYTPCNNDALSAMCYCR